LTFPLPPAGIANALRLPQQLRQLGDIRVGEHFLVMKRGI